MTPSGRVSVAFDEPTSVMVVIVFPLAQSRILTFGAPVAPDVKSLSMRPLGLQASERVPLTVVEGVMEFIAASNAASRTGKTGILAENVALSSAGPGTGCLLG